MKIKFFSDTDTALMEFSEKEVDETREVSENIYVDLDENGNLVSMTVEHAKERADFPKVVVEEIRSASNLQHPTEWAGTHTWERASRKNMKIIHLQPSLLGYHILHPFHPPSFVASCEPISFPSQTPFHKPPSPTPPIFIHQISQFSILNSQFSPHLFPPRLPLNPDTITTTTTTTTTNQAHHHPAIQTLPHRNH